MSDDREAPTREPVRPAWPSSLLVIEWRSRGQAPVTTRLRGAHLVIGRAPTCDIYLAGEDVSRRHAEIVPSPPGRFVVRDLGSRNGVRLNGRPIYDAVLSPDDLVEIGSWRGSVLPATDIEPRPPGSEPSMWEARLVRAASAWRLTPRERQVVGFVIDAKSNVVIADLLDVTSKTVEAHLSNVYRKAGVDGRVDLLRAMVELE